MYVYMCVSYMYICVYIYVYVSYTHIYDMISYMIYIYHPTLKLFAPLLDYELFSFKVIFNGRHHYQHLG